MSLNVPEDAGIAENVTEGEKEKWLTICNRAIRARGRECLALRCERLVCGLVTQSIAARLDCDEASCRVGTELGQTVGRSLVGVASTKHPLPQCIPNRRSERLFPHGNGVWRRRNG